MTGFIMHLNIIIWFNWLNCISPSQIYIFYLFVYIDILYNKCINYWIIWLYLRGEFFMIASFSYYMLNIFVPPSAASKYSMLLIYPFTAFSFFFFLGGTKSFKFILICLFFNSILPIEGISATILSLIGLLFPKLHIVSVFIGLDGNPFSISLLCIFEIITYMKQMQEKGDQL